jgi:thiol-disulfide isomerase/thioredoxin
MKKYILSIMLAVVALSSCAGNKEQESADRSQENTPATDISTDSSSDLAPDFTLNDLSGKPLTLSSLRGKYVILDFWGSWCVWCIKGIPQMKEYYQKYAGKFEILGIDCNDTEEKWKAAVEKHELPWLHVYNPRDSKVLEQYEIQGFPTKIIVGPDGKIVKTIIGEDPAFYRFLDELFK